MNAEAEKLNSILADSIGGRLLSKTGIRFFFPRGIVYQCGQASEHAWKYNVSVGMAFANGEPLETPALKNQLPQQKSSEAVSYAPTPGDRKLTALWKNEILTKNPSINADFLSDSVLVPGLTNGISQAASLFINPGDTVILPDLHWDNYRLIFDTRHAASLRFYPLFDKDNRFHSAALVKTAREASSGKLCFIFNFPNNPSGYTLTGPEADECISSLVRLADEGRDILCICDDSYFGLFYEKDCYKESLFARLSKAHRNILAVKVDGATKEHFFWGMRIGFMTYGSAGMSKDQLAALVEKTIGFIRASVSSSSRIGQTLLLNVLSDNKYSEQKASLQIDLENRYKKVREIIDSHNNDPWLEPFPFNSGYFLCFKTCGDAEKLRHYLLFEKGIGAVALGKNYLRIAYALINGEDIKDLFDIVYEAAALVFG